MSDSFEIIINKADNGYTFLFQQDHLTQPINCAGSQQLLTVKSQEQADALKKSIENNAIWFDEEDHLIISSPLYFLHSIESTGTEWLLEQVENWAIFWSMDPFFHDHNSSLRESAPLVSYLQKTGLNSENLPGGDYENWEDLEEQHFLPEKMVNALTGQLVKATGGKKLAGFYFAFNSPHIVAGLAWVNGFFSSDDEFVQYTLLAEKFNGKEKERTAEIYYRLEQIAEVKSFIKQPGKE